MDKKPSTKDKVSLLQEEEIENTSTVSWIEDTAMKEAASFFINEFGKVFGIPEGLVAITQTELISLHVNRSHLDFTYKLTDRKWVHLEFQSTNGGLKNLRRFRAYDAILSHKNHVEVETYVLFSGHIQNPMCELVDCSGTYRVIPITLYTYNADQKIESAVEKLHNQIPLTRKDLLTLSLTPLMGGKTTQLERISKVYRMIRMIPHLNDEDRKVCETLLYLFSLKFLTPKEKIIFMEDFAMSDLAQMIYDKAADDVAKNIARNLLDILDNVSIAQRTNLPVETVVSLRASAALATS